jgi:vacuolar-type H+-ATPase subunit I/STV1
VSYKTLWEHNKKFHKNEPNTDVAVCCGNVAECCGNVAENKNETNIDVVENNNKKIICKYCNKCFNHRSNKFNHEKICKLKNNNSESEIIELKKENKEIKKENEEIKNSLKELKELIIKK